MFNIKSLANWKELSIKKQNLVDKANLRENQKRVDYKVYVIKDGVYHKLDAPKLGQFSITGIYTNGTVRIKRGNSNERINIIRLKPHFE